MRNDCSSARVIAGLALLLTIRNAEALNWSDRAPVSPVRANHAAGVIADKIYIAGGGFLGGFAWFSHATGAVYDPTLDSWTPIALMSVPRTWAASAVADKEVAPGVLEPRLFVIGGSDIDDFPFDYTIHQSIEVYDPGTDSWSLFPATFPAAAMTSGMAAATIDNLIYVLGGDRIDASTVANTVFVIDPIAETISPLPIPMPSPGGSGYGEGALVAVGRKLYYMGGWEDQYGVPSSTVTILDVDSRSWTTGARVPHPVANAAAVVSGATIYLIGGWDGASATFNNVFAYDTLTDTWSSDNPLNCSPDTGVPALTGRTGASAHRVVVGGKDELDVVGGAAANINELSCHEHSSLIAPPADSFPPVFAGVTNAIESSCPAESAFDVVIGWSAASDATPPVYYNIYRSTDPGFVPAPANLVASDLSGLSYADRLSGADCGLAYYWVVRARDSATPANEDPNLVRATLALACLDPAPPPDLDNILHLVHPSAVPHLDWSTYPAPGAASHYHVYRAALKTTLPGPKLLDATLTSSDDSTGGALEFYQVRAAIDCGDRESSN